jgi:hypothetical protein
MTTVTVEPLQMLERILSLEIVRVTGRAAVSAARLRGRGDEKAADQAAVDAMRRGLNKLPIDGTVVIGEGERDEAPMLFIGEAVGSRKGPKVDIAVDPLEGTTLCAKNMPGSIATMAMAEGGSLLNAPDIYMEKIAIGHWPIALRFAAPNWMGWSAERCSEELRHWTEIIEQPDYAVRIWRDIPRISATGCLARACRSANWRQKWNSPAAGRGIQGSA